jgi:hypothetical protein
VSADEAIFVLLLTLIVTLFDRYRYRPEPAPA